MESISSADVEVVRIKVAVRSWMSGCKLSVRSWSAVMYEEVSKKRVLRVQSRRCEGEGPELRCMTSESKSKLLEERSRDEGEYAAETGKIGV